MAFCEIQKEKLCVCFRRETRKSSHIKMVCAIKEKKKKNPHDLKEQTSFI